MSLFFGSSQIGEKKSYLLLFLWKKFWILYFSNIYIYMFYWIFLFWAIFSAEILLTAPLKVAIQSCA